MTIHIISGNNFHGDYEVHLRGPSEGFILSKSQAKKLNHALCDYEGCQCAGGYGNGPNAGTARVVEIDCDKYELIPAGRF